MKSIIFIIITRLGGVVPQIQIPGSSTQEMSTGRTQSSCGFTTTITFTTTTITIKTTMNNNNNSSTICCWKSPNNKNNIVIINNKTMPL